MKRSKHGLFVFPPKKTLIWRRHCSIDQSCCSMTSKQFLESSSGMKFVYPSVRLANQKPGAFVSVRYTNQIALFSFVCCFCFVRAFSSQGHTKIALSKFKCSFVVSIRFLQKYREEAAELSTRFILSYRVLNSRHPSILESTDITRRILILIALSNLVSGTWEGRERALASLVTCPLVNPQNCSKNTGSSNNNLLLSKLICILSLPQEKHL